MAWWTMIAAKLAPEAGRALARTFGRKGAAAGAVVEAAAGISHGPVFDKAAPAGLLRLAVLTIPGRLTPATRDRLADHVRGALHGFGDFRLLALEEGIGIRFYAGAGEVSALEAGQVLDLQAWKVDALGALQSAIEALGPAYDDRAGGPALARAEAERQIRSAAGVLMGIHPAAEIRPAVDPACDPRRG